MGFIGTLTDTDSSIVDGSVQNKELQNCTVSYGGISLSLGGVCATPQFNLINGYNYPAGCLSGGTLNSGVTASSLTSVGSLASLDVVGVATFGSNFKVGTATTLRSDGSATFAGPVGIGTDNPTSKLDVAGTVTATRVNAGSNTHTEYSIVGYNNDSNTVSSIRSTIFAQNFGGGLVWQGYNSTQETSRIVADGSALFNGNVEIGDYSGGNAGVSLASGGGVSIRNQNNAVGGATLFTLSAADTEGVVKMFTDGSANFAGGDGITANQTFGIDQFGRLSIREDASTPADVFSIYKGSSSTKTVSISNDGSATFAGSVGIGTDNPATKLEILHIASRKHQFSYDDSILTIKGANASGNPETLRFIGGESLIFNTGTTGSGTESLRITSDGNVGIGSTIPAAKLDVVGSILSGFHGININNEGNGVSNEAFSVDSAPGNSVYTRKTTLYTDGSAEFAGDINIGDSSGDSILLRANPATIRANATTSTTSVFVGQNNTTTTTIISADGSATFAGSVGIGTDNPATNLDVAGSILSGGLYSDKLMSKTTANDSSTIIGARNALGTEVTVMTVNVAGLVGIGTMDPEQLLHIENTSSPTIYIQSASTIIGTFGQLEFGNGTGNTSVKSKIKSYRIGPSGDARSALAFETTNTSGTTSEAMRIDSDGRLLLGTTSTRQVGSTTNSTSIFDTDNEHTIVSIVANSPAGGTLCLSGTGGTTVGNNTIVSNGQTLGGIRFVGADGNDLQSNAARIIAQVDGIVGVNSMPGRLVFSTSSDGSASPTERMRITSDGNFGIGTQSPSTLLEVSATITNGPVIRLNNANTSVNSDDEYGRIEWNTNDASGGGTGISNYIAAHAENAGVRAALTFGVRHDSGVFEAMRITSGGSVGFRTDSILDNAKVQHYQSNIRYQSFQSSNGDLAIVTDNNDVPAAYIKGTGTADLLNVFDNTTNVFTIKDGGNVGIGTDNPTSKLEIKTPSTDTIGTGHIGFAAASTPLWVWRTGTLNSDLNLDRYSGGWSATPALTIKRDTGNIGIGTDNPTSKIHIHGTDQQLRFVRSAGDRFGGIRYDASNFRVTLPAADNLIIEESSGTTDLVKISPTGEVNIGAASPISDGSGVLNVYSSTSGALSQFVHASGNGGLRIGGTGPGSSASLVFSNDYNTSWTDEWTIRMDGSDDSLQFLSGGVSGTERVRITSGGLVGIGTDNPTVPLDVAGAARFAGKVEIERGFTSDTDYHLFIKQTTNTEGATIKLSDKSDDTQFGLFTYKHADLSSNNAADSFHFNSSEVSTAVIIDKTGSNAGFYVGTNEVWHQGNDGASSGLDADCLDGNQGSHFLDYNNFTNTPTIPTNNNQLTNGAGYITSSGTAALAEGLTGTPNITVGTVTATRFKGSVCCNIWFGCCPGANHTSGKHNNFLGRYAGQCNTSGSYNNFFGRSAGKCNTTGRDNNFIGKYAGDSNTTGCFNNFLGWNAGCSNTTGLHNNFFGSCAGRDNIDGCYNNFLGNGTGRCNTSGSNNNFFGLTAGFYNTTGSDNIFFGVNSGRANTTGSGNIFLNFGSGCTNTIGNFNTFIGSCAGACNTSGTNNIAIGCKAGTTSGGLCTLSTTNNYIIMGNTSHTCAEIQISWTPGSDIRDKCVYGPVPHGKAFLQNINPITYSFKDRETGELTDITKRYGFSAQEIHDLEDEEIIVSDNGNRLGLTHDYLLPVIVNAIKELSAENQELRDENQELRARIIGIENEIGISTTST